MGNLRWQLPLRALIRGLRKRFAVQEWEVHPFAGTAADDLGAGGQARVAQGLARFLRGAIDEVGIGGCPRE